jgi:hypothetical protein
VTSRYTSANPTERARDGVGRRLLALPETNVSIFAFLLNYPWEFLQVPFFAGMAEATHWDAVLFCSRAAAGDVVIMLVAFWSVALATRSREWIRRPTRMHVIAFAGVGVVITLLFEWIATDILNRWQYSTLMPTLPVIGTGLTPVLQWILLPPLAVWFVHRQLRCTSSR